MRFKSVVEKEIPIFGRDTELNANLKRDTYKIEKTGKHTRYSYGKKYENLKIVLPSEYNDLIGRYFMAFRGKAWWKCKGKTMKGECIVLLFPDEWKGLKHKPPIITSIQANKHKALIGNLK